MAVISMGEPTRCDWNSIDDPLYRTYHDTEWGVPVHDDRRIFEYLILEGFQAGLSWYTVLKKRSNFRKAFDDFNPETIAGYDSEKISQILSDPSIIRNRLKVESAVNNAKAFLKVQKEFGSFDRYIWGFVDYRPILNRWRSTKEVPSTSPISDKLSRDLVSRGFRFVGSTICYAHMQATGMVNDHLISCFRYREIIDSLGLKGYTKYP
jgi:DNA-3-methyladenine glycosylase I